MEDLLLPVELSAITRMVQLPHLIVSEDDPVVGLQEEPSFDPKNPHLRKLVEDILFSRRFILSYFFVIGALVFLFAIRHWCGKWRRHRSMSALGLGVRSGIQTADSGASSSSSTLRGVESPADATSLALEPAEDTPLLRKDHIKISQVVSQSSFFHRLGMYMRAWLISQPAPIPALTATRNTLPPNETSLLLILLLGVNVFYLFYQTPISLPMLFALADRAGLCFVANIPVLYVLAAKNNQPLKFLTGWSYEGLNIFHRRLGEWMTILATVHTVGMFGVWYTLLRPSHFTLIRFLSSRLVLLGIFAFVSYLAIYVTSTGLFRQLYYEAFLGLHITLQVAALVLLFFHHSNARPYVVAASAVWALDRVLSRFSISTKSFTADLQIAEDGETVLLFCQIPITLSKISALDIRYGWRPGQHVFLTIPSLGWYHRLQAHPFSIASPAPSQQSAPGHWPLQLIIRAKDGFSKDLLTYARFHQHTQVFLDGPYGNNEALESLQAADRRCLIAGGSGIAVTYPLAWNLQKPSCHGEEPISTRTVYYDGRKHTPNVSIKERPSTGRYAHFWVRSEPSHAAWITLLPKVETLPSTFLATPPVLSQDEDVVAVDDLITESFSTHSKAVTTDCTRTGDGRPDMQFVLRDWVVNIKPEHIKQVGRHNKVAVVVSGPDGLVRQVQNTAAQLTIEGWNIEVQVEKFGW